MTTPNEREARELLAREYRAKWGDDAAVQVLHGPWSMDQDAAIRAIIAALTREQREGCVCGNPSATNTVHRTDGPCYQQEAPAAVAWMRYPIRDGVLHHVPEFASDGAWVARLDQRGAGWIPLYAATPPAPVDVRKPMNRFVELLAQLVNAPQTDDEFGADMLRREVVMEKVTQLRVVWDDLSKAHRALLSGQQAAEWRPIETAPKGGHTVWLAGEGCMRLGWWCNAQERWIDQAAADANEPVRGLRFAPLRWHPIPAMLAIADSGAGGG